MEILVPILMAAFILILVAVILAMTYVEEWINKINFMKRSITSLKTDLISLEDKFKTHEFRQSKESLVILDHYLDILNYIRTNVPKT